MKTPPGRSESGNIGSSRGTPGAAARMWNDEFARHGIPHRVDSMEDGAEHRHGADVDHRRRCHRRSVGRAGWVKLALASALKTTMSRKEVNVDVGNGESGKEFLFGS